MQVADIEIFPRQYDRRRLGCGGSFASLNLGSLTLVKHWKVCHKDCHVLQQNSKDVKPWKPKVVSHQGCSMRCRYVSSPLFGARAIQFVFRRWATKQRLTHRTAQHVLEYPVFLEWIWALENIWTYCGSARSYLAAFLVPFWSSDRPYWRAIQYILYVGSLKNPIWDHQ